MEVAITSVIAVPGALRAVDRFDRADTREELDDVRLFSRTLIYEFFKTAKPEAALAGDAA